MISSHIDIHSQDGCIVLSPNSSARWQTTKIFLFIVSFFSLTIAVSFALVGLWMVLPFAGLEVLALLLVMYRVARKCYRKEVIYLSQNKVRVERGISKPQLTWESELFWTRLIVPKATHGWHSPKIILRGRNQQIEVGSFLLEQEKHELVKQLGFYISKA